MSDSKEPQESGEPRQREKITLDTEIPPLPSKAERLVAPDEDKFERDLKSFEGKIKRLRDKKKGVHDQIKEKKEGGKMDNADLSVKEFIGGKRTSKKDFITAKNKLRDELDQLKTDFYQMVDEQKKIRPKIKIFDKEKTEREIENIQTRIETTTLSLHDEKKLISDLSALQLSVPLITIHNTRAKKLDENKARQEVIKLQIGEINKQIDHTTALIEETSSKIQSGKDNLKQELPSLFEETKKVQEEIEALEAEKKKFYEDFRAKKNAFLKQQREIKQIEFITKMKAKLVEQEERRKKQEEYEKQAELNKPHPYANEILSCDAFIAYLSKYIPKENVEVAKNDRQLTENYLPDKSELNAKESEQWFGAKEKKQKKKRTKKQKNNEGLLGSQPIDLLNFFSYCGIKVPTNVDEAKAAIEELESKKKQWEGMDTRETENQEEKKSRKDAENKKHTDISLNPVNFPAPEDSKAVEKYGIFKDEGPVPAQTEQFRGKRGKRRGGK